MHRNAVHQQINYIRSEKQKEKPHNNMAWLWKTFWLCSKWMAYKIIISCKVTWRLAIEHLTSQWCIVLHLKGEVIVSDIINFVQGIFQGDSLSDLLFILSVNPVWFLSITSLSMTLNYMLLVQNGKLLQCTKDLQINQLPIKPMKGIPKKIWVSMKISAILGQ